MLVRGPPTVLAAGSSSRPSQRSFAQIRSRIAGACWPIPAVIDGVFVTAAAGAGCDAPQAFLPARPITQLHLAAVSERVRRRVIRWFSRTRLLDAAAAADMLAWENSGFSIAASVRITLFRLQLRVYCQPLEHLLRR